MKIILLSLITVIGFSVSANESKNKSYDCKFTNEEVQQALQNPISDYFAGIEVVLKDGSFKVTDSSVDPKSLSTIPNMIAKKVEFEATTGEKLALQSFGRNGDLQFLNMVPTVDGLLFHQSKYTEFDKLGNETQSVCVLSVRSKGLFMVFKNLNSDQKLIDLTKEFNKFMGDNLNALSVKAVP